MLESVQKNHGYGSIHIHYLRRGNEVMMHMKNQPGSSRCYKFWTRMRWIKIHIIKGRFHNVGGSLLRRRWLPHGRTFRSLLKHTFPNTYKSKNGRSLHTFNKVAWWLISTLQTSTTWSIFVEVCIQWRTHESWSMWTD